jgi:hypothetical protein
LVETKEDQLRHGLDEIESAWLSIFRFHNQLQFILSAFATDLLVLL